MVREKKGGLGGKFRTLFFFPGYLRPGGDGPIPSSWLRRAKGQAALAASLLRTLQHAKATPLNPWGLRLASPTTSMVSQSLEASLRQSTNPLHIAFHPSQHTTERSLRCHAPRWGGTRHDAVRTHDRPLPLVPASIQFSIHCFPPSGPKVSHRPDGKAAGQCPKAQNSK